MNDFFKRLKQRKLVQWAIAYTAAAFVLLGGVENVAHSFAWPGAIERGFIIAASVGFFFVLVLAWYHGERGAQHVSGTELLILALLLTLGGALLWGVAGRTGASADQRKARFLNEPSVGKADASTPKPIPIVNTSAHLNDRPWLSVEITPSGVIKYYDQGGLNFSLRFRVTNHGHSPATDVRIKSELVFSAFSDAIKEQQRVAHRIAGGQAFGSGVVFPGVPVEVELVHLSNINEAIASIPEPERRGKTMPRSLSEAREWNEFVRPSIAGCITYKFGPPEAQLVGETGFVRMIMQRRENTPGFFLLKLGEDVPQELVLIETYPQGGDYAR